MQRNTNLILISIILDALCLVAAVFLSSWLRLHLPFGRYLPDVTQEAPLLIEALLIYPLIFLLVSLYDPDRTLYEWNEFLALCTACFVSGLALAGLIYFTIREISRLLLVYFFILHFLFVLGWRPLVYSLVRFWKPGGNGQRRVLLVGKEPMAGEVMDRLLQHPGAGFHLVGYLAEVCPPQPETFQLACLGSIDQVLQVVQDQQIDDVLIVLPGEAFAQARQIVTSLIESTTNVWIVPDYFSLLVYGGKVQNLDGISLISLKAPTLTGYQRMLKRLFDLLLGAALLVLSLPLFAVIAILIRLDSPGPVILRQVRVGENRRLFKMIKFRSMVANAMDEEEGGLRVAKNEQLQYKLPNDPRVTHIGRFLRRASLDELPQLWNVLKGEMSLVGPRPELPRLVAHYESWQQKRFAVPQGITGWWQVNGRSDRPMHLHTEDDLYYVQNYSIWLDIQILLRTVWVVLRGKGAF